jgi:SAM-dependent methyltransferase
VNEWHRHYERKALSADGDTLAAVDWIIPAAHRQQMAAFRKLIGELPGGALILDAGCGNGLSWQAILPDRAAFGVDYVHAMCALAARKGMSVAQGDLLRLPFKTGQFDVVYCAEVIQCFPDAPQALAELARVCRPGGRIVLSTINRRGVLLRSIRWVVRAVRSAIGGQHPPEALFMRRPIEIARAAMPLELRKVAWLNFPLPWTRITRTPASILEPLAWKYALEFVVQDHGPSLPRRSSQPVV